MHQQRPPSAAELIARAERQRPSDKSDTARVTSRHPAFYAHEAVERARATWTDERLDDLSRRVDDGFNRVDEDLRQLRSEMNSLQRTTIQIGGATIATVLATLASVIVTRT